MIGIYSYYVSIKTYIYIYIYIHTHIYIHTYIHTYIYIYILVFKENMIWINFNERFKYRIEFKSVKNNNRIMACK